MGLLDGKVAIITGAGGGLGEAYAKLFAREGAAIVVNDLGGPRDGSGGDKSMAQKVVDAIKAEGGRAVANGADISTMAGASAMVEHAVARFGGIDVLVNNAGIAQLDSTGSWNCTEEVLTMTPPPFSRIHLNTGWVQQ